MGDEYVFIAGSTVGPADEKLALTLCWRWRAVSAVTEPLNRMPERKLITKTRVPETHDN